MRREQFQEIIAEATKSRELAAEAEWVKLDYDAPASYAELRRTGR